MTRTRFLIMEILRNLLLANLCLAVVFFGQYHLSGGTAAILRALVLIPLFFLTWPMRKIRRRFWHFLFPVLAYFLFLYGVGRLLPSQPPAEWLDAFPFLAAAQAVLFAFFAVYALGITVFERFAKPADITVGYLIVSVMLFFFLYLNAPAASPLRVALHFLTVFHLVLFVIHMQMDNFSTAMYRYAASGKQPVDRISRLGNRLLTGFLLFLGAVALLAPYGATVINTLFRGLLAGIRWLTSWLRFSEGTVATQPPASTPVETEQGDGLPVIEASLFWQIVTRIIEVILYVLMAACVIGAVAGLVYACIRIYRRFYEERATDGDVRIRLSRTRADRQRAPGSSPAGTAKPRRGLTSSPADRIRRLFIRTVERAAKARRIELRNSDTARVISDKVSHATSQDLIPLATLYDKARYGPAGAVTREDVKTAAAATRKG